MTQGSAENCEAALHDVAYQGAEFQREHIIIVAWGHTGVLCVLLLADKQGGGRGGGGERRGEQAHLNRAIGGYKLILEVR